MAEIDLKEFERKVRVRQLTIDDYEPLVDMQRRSFPGMPTWGRAQIASQLERFPEGQLGIEYEGQLVASSSSLIVTFSEYADWHNWKHIADHGFIRNHDPEGDTLYGIEIMVDPEFRGLKLSRRLYDARKDLCRRYNLARIVIAGRIPHYHQYADQMSAREYVERVMKKELYDPVLTAQVANGFMLRGLIPHYLPNDKASGGYATFLEWSNLDYVPEIRGRSRRYYRPFEPVRIAAVQFEMRAVSDFEEFARQCEYFVDVASDYKADFVVYPELFTNELLSAMPPDRPGLAARRLAEYTPEYLDLFSQLSIKYNVNIIGGSHFTVDDDRLYNTSYLFRRDGTIERQRKIHITPSERRWWGVTPGEQLHVFETDCGRVAILICYDIEFPELARVAADQGAQILFVPFNTDNREGYLRVRYCSQARCIENHVYVVISGCTGNLPFVENADIHYAQSGIFAPSDLTFARDGVVGEATENIETVLIHDVDLELLKRHRSSGTVQNWNDRRRDLYQVVYRDGEQQREV